MTDALPTTAPPVISDASLPPLAAIAQAIGTLDPERALDSLLQTVLTAVGGRFGLIVVPEEKLRRMIALQAHPLEWAITSDDNGGYSTRLHPWWLEPQPRLLTADEVATLQLPPPPNPVGSGLLIPLPVAGRPIGLLLLLREAGQPEFTATERDRVGLLAPFLATVARTEQLHNEMRHKNTRLATLYEISQKTESLVNLRDIYDSMAKVVKSFIDCDILMLYFTTSDGTALETREPIPASPFPDRVKVGQGPIGLAASELRHQLTYTQEFKSVLILPMVVSGKLIGVVAIGSRQSYAYREEDIIGLRIITTQIAGIDELFKDLLRLRGFTQHILEAFPAGIITFDAAHRVTLTNPAVQQLFGRDIPLGTVLTEATDLIPVPVREELRQMLGESHRVEARRVEVGSGPGQRILELNVFPFRDENGRPLGIASFLRDVTDLERMAEQLKRADRLSALGILASGIAHEIRNPLTGIKMIAQLLADEFSNETQRREPLRIILDEIDRLEKLICNLLDFARPSRPRLVPIELPKLLEDCLLLLHNQITKAGLVVERRMTPELPSITGDPDQLKQVFLNILTNAVQATPTGGRMIVQVEPKGDDLTVVIEDSGCGIAAERLREIFDPFYTTKDDGTGLGLSIAQRIVEKHLGRIEVHSVLGQGSRFAIVLPRRTDSESSG